MQQRLGVISRKHEDRSQNQTGWVKLWRCVDKPRWPQDMMKQSLKRPLAPVIPPRRSADQHIFQVKMAQNFTSQQRRSYLNPVSFSLILWCLASLIWTLAGQQGWKGEKACKLHLNLAFNLVFQKCRDVFVFYWTCQLWAFYRTNLRRTVHYLTT